MPPAGASGSGMAPTKRAPQGLAVVDLEARSSPLPSPQDKPSRPGPASPEGGTTAEGRTRLTELSAKSQEIRRCRFAERPMLGIFDNPAPQVRPIIALRCVTVPDLRRSKPHDRDPKSSNLWLHGMTGLSANGLAESRPGQKRRWHTIATALENRRAVPVACPIGRVITGTLGYSRGTRSWL